MTTKLSQLLHSLSPAARRRILTVIEHGEKPKKLKIGSLVSLKIPFLGRAKASIMWLPDGGSECFILKIGPYWLPRTRAEFNA